MAAQNQLYLFANGDVGPCCRNRTYGNVADQGLLDIWRGARREQLMDRLANWDFGGGCQLCGTEAELEGRQDTFVSTFDHWAEVLDARHSVPQWPVRMEFEISSLCNLQCVQCNGNLSSSIRIHREHRAPMKNPYGEPFFADLPAFLPNLRHASFAGGEPFLAPEYFRVWDLVEEHSPGLPCIIVTNGTQWNRRVEHVLEALDVQPYLSIDGITKDTYESIRVGSDFDVVMANVDRFNAYASSRGHTMSIVFCLMPDNVHELPEMLSFAEERGIYVTISNVREPAVHSLGHLPRARLAEISVQLAGRDDDMSRTLELNLPTWKRELARLGAWLADGSEEGEVPTDEASVWVRRSPKLLMFPRRGGGATSTAEQEALLSTWCDGGAMGQMRVGPDERIKGSNDLVASVLGTAASELEGRPLSVLEGLVESYEVIQQSDDVYVAEFTPAAVNGPQTYGRIVLLADRDETGLATEVVVLVGSLLRQRP